MGTAGPYEGSRLPIGITETFWLFLTLAARRQAVVKRPGASGFRDPWRRHVTRPGVATTHVRPSGPPVLLREVGRSQRRNEWTAPDTAVVSGMRITSRSKVAELEAPRSWYFLLGSLITGQSAQNSHRPSTKRTRGDQGLRHRRLRGSRPASARPHRLGSLHEQTPPGQRLKCSPARRSTGAPSDGLLWRHRPVRSAFGPTDSTPRGHVKGGVLELRSSLVHLRREHGRCQVPRR